MLHVEMLQYVLKIVKVHNGSIQKERDFRNACQIILNRNCYYFLLSVLIFINSIFSHLVLFILF